MESSAENIELLKAIDLAKKSMKPLKRSKVSEEGYKYVTLDDVLELLKKTLPKHKLGFVQQIERCENGNCLLTTVFHLTSGQYMTSSTYIPDVKDDFLSIMQSVGSNITYMRRYALCTIFGIVSEDDTDGKSSFSGYTQQEKSLIEKKCSEMKISADNLKKVKSMVNSNVATSIILQRIESMK